MLLDEMAGRFARVEARHSARAFLRGLLAELPDWFAVAGGAETAFVTGDWQWSVRWCQRPRRSGRPATGRACYSRSCVHRRRASAARRYGHRRVCPQRTCLSVGTSSTM